MEHKTKKIDNQSMSVWETTWAYKIKSDADVQSSGSSLQQDLEGNFFFSDAYPGCPYCGKKKLALCGECNKLLCWDADQSVVVCPWDNKTLRVSGEVDKVHGGRDR
jgi:hypothetical protein